MAVAKLSCHHPPILGCDLAPGVATISSSCQHSVAGFSTLMHLRLRLFCLRSLNIFFDHEGRTSVLPLLCSRILIVVIMHLAKRQRDPTRLQFGIPCPALDFTSVTTTHR